VKKCLQLYIHSDAP